MFVLDVGSDFMMSETTRVQARYQAGRFMLSIYHCHLLPV
jgi:hypothetical protein